MLCSSILHGLQSARSTRQRGLWHLVLEGWERGPHLFDRLFIDLTAEVRAFHTVLHSEPRLQWTRACSYTDLFELQSADNVSLQGQLFMIIITFVLNTASLSTLLFFFFTAKYQIHGPQIAARSPYVAPKPPVCWLFKLRICRPWAEHCCAFLHCVLSTCKLAVISLVRW